MDGRQVVKVTLLFEVEDDVSSYFHQCLISCITFRKTINKFIHLC
ncbi:MAG: hypothetical protein KatS3mg027_2151 [Bacteroidia bacterium]|nr:MAG: hypothetical protein KatS3mg027_2151 [Bacteroidia bacterium]